jgi:putative RNA 2'-phosphotransferase
MWKVWYCKTHGYYRDEEKRCENCVEIMDEEKAVRLGKLLSGILRHFPERFGVRMSVEGWANLDYIARVLSKRNRWVRKKHIIALVKSDEKGRYEIKRNMIRARYGHSINVDLDYEDNELEKLYYGSNEEEAERILEIGLKPVKQRYVHLSTSVEKAIEVGSLRSDNPVIIEVDAKKAQEDGIRIMKATEHIALAEEIPPKYLRIISESMK